VGRSIQLTTPASVSKAIGPVFIESIEVILLEESYWNAPPSITNPELRVVVALGPIVLKDRRAVLPAVVVAIVHA